MLASQPTCLFNFATIYVGSSVVVVVVVVVADALSGYGCIGSKANMPTRAQAKVEAQALECEQAH